MWHYTWIRSFQLWLHIRVTWGAVNHCGCPGSPEVFVWSSPGDTNVQYDFGCDFNTLCRPHSLSFSKFSICKVLCGSWIIHSHQIPHALRTPLAPIPFSQHYPHPQNKNLFDRVVFCHRLNSLTVPSLPTVPYGPPFLPHLSISTILYEAGE